MSKYLLIMVTMTSFNGGTVNVISTHDTISECHVALTQHGFTDSQMQNAFCLIMEDGVDWRLDNGQG